jgi:hypothetical protein
MSLIISNILFRRCRERRFVIPPNTGDRREMSDAQPICSRSRGGSTVSGIVRWVADVQNWSRCEPLCIPTPIHQESDHRFTRNLREAFAPYLVQSVYGIRRSSDTTITSSSCHAFFAFGLRERSKTLTEYARSL